ncbi:MAG TPA: class I SAM-dependent methyltransferase [Candidatus Ozemobacteraceae bacterium]|nr:class I SAM-dependent methyltransferase [Candidatus Ozemobacteraceae bacterium]
MTDRCGGYAEHAFIAGLYDHLPAYRNRPDVTFFVEEAVACGGPVLELGCGTGRVLIPTARRGVPVVGLDLSPVMLNTCRQFLRQEPEEVQARVELQEGDLRSFNLGRTFPLITTPFRPFQHLLTVEDQIACLQAMRRHLTPEGRLILDLFNPSIYYLAHQGHTVEFGDDPEFALPDGSKVRRKFRIPRKDLHQQINDCESIFYVTHPDGSQERLVHTFQIRYLYRFEVEHLLVRCGFKLLHVWCDYQRTPYGARYPGEMIFVATPDATEPAE